MIYSKPIPGKLYAFLACGLRCPLYDRAYTQDHNVADHKKTYILPFSENFDANGRALLPTCLVVKSIGWPKDSSPVLYGLCDTNRPSGHSADERWVVLFGERLVVIRAEYLQPIQGITY